jgi:hypothetical protein
MEASNHGSLNGCENCTGFCNRHGIRKNSNWLRLCQTKQAYFDAWEAGRGPGQERDPSKAKERVDAHERQIELYHALWRELHTKQDPTPEWFSDWVSRVPGSSCKCQSWLQEYLRESPPRYDDFAAWSVELHNAVNAKLGKPTWVASSVLMPAGEPIA